MIDLLHGDVLDVLPRLAEEIRAGERLPFQTCITSPPYWGLRDYGLEPSVWGGDLGCRHVWGEVIPGDPRGGSGPDAKEAYAGDGKTTYARQVERGQFCSLCGAWCGCLGLEPEPSLYVVHLVRIFGLVRDVLAEDGTCWIVIGDSYACTPKGSLAGQDKSTLTSTRTQEHSPAGGANKLAGSDLKPKDMVGIPWLIALALRDDGWWLRNAIVWHKPNPMPESVTDRCTSSYEFVFLLAKAGRYYYDNEAVKEPNADPGRTSYTSGPGTQHNHYVNEPRETVHAYLNGYKPGSGRNRRDVWTIATESYRGAHFATYPRALIEPCILAGTSEKGCCPHCGKPWERVVEREATNHRAREDRQVATGGAITGGVGKNFPDVSIATTGWRPTCSCPPAEPIPCWVLDPFIGSGTTALVARQHGRHCTGIEKSAEYLELARHRMNGTEPVEIATPEDDTVVAEQGVLW